MSYCASKVIAEEGKRELRKGGRVSGRTLVTLDDEPAACAAAVAQFLFPSSHHLAG